MYTLLIVDDERDIREGLARYFPWESVGFTVEGTYEGGQQALERVAAGGIDVILSDIEMPGLSGLQLAEEVRRSAPGVKVVLLSAFRKFEYAQKARECRVVKYITKPTVHSEIQEVFSQLKRELDAEQGAEQPRQEPETENYQQGLLKQIREEIGRDLRGANLVSVADALGRSPSFVSRMCVEIAGQTFTEMLTQARMEMARHLLNQVEYHVYDVSEAVGYTNAKNFTRAYKKYWGCTPRELRSGEKEG